MNGLAASTLLRRSDTKVQISWSPPVEVSGMKSKVKREAEKDALRLVRATFRRGFPVDPVGIASDLGVKVLESEFDQDILGALFMKPGGDPDIVLNRRHSVLRRRATCALELGHYVRMSARTSEYKRADLYEESEEVGGESDDLYASQFAACLLMPAEDVKILADLKMDDLEMALRLLVPREVMQARLGELGLSTWVLEAA
jgi:Zn-dependent peptidase ImmA (M78 family)